MNENLLISVIYKPRQEISLNTIFFIYAKVLKKVTNCMYLHVSNYISIHSLVV